MVGPVLLDLSPILWLEPKDLLSLSNASRKFSKINIVGYEKKSRTFSKLVFHNFPIGSEEWFSAPEISKINIFGPKKNHVPIFKLVFHNFSIGSEE